MYRLVLDYLLLLVGVAVAFSALGSLSFNPLGLLFSALFLVAVSWAANEVFARVYHVAVNNESVIISALVLSLIITPARNLYDLPFFFWAAVWAAAGKFILAFHKKHLFNPAALAVFLTAVFLGRSASWWVGSAFMFFPVLLGGWLIVRKTQREEMVGAFFLAAVLTILALNFVNGPDLVTLLSKTFLETPLLFFGFVMLTEPLTTPLTKNLRLIYGALTGFLFAPQLHFGAVYFLPEQALLLGNIFSFLVSSKDRLVLTLKERIPLGTDVYDFVFTGRGKFNYTAGQYLEWTLGHGSPDSRGVRRYFTLASSPTENDLRLGVKFAENGSSFKKALLNLSSGGEISASSLAGDFTLPRDPNTKLAFLAGGIGITPFRSMIKSLLDMADRRNVVMVYAEKEGRDFLYRDIFSAAQNLLGLKTVYSSGRFGQDLIRREIPDYKERLFYLSGPRAMVDSFQKILLDLRVAKDRIKTDFFPGF